MKKAFFLYLFIGLFSLPGVAICSSVPRVIVTIKPLHSLVAGVMQGVGEPQLLVKGGSSPHGYILRPSDARNLARADLVVWIGAGLESFLEKPLSTLGHNARQLQLAEQLQHNLLRKVQSDDWEQPSHRHHQKESADLHLWLDPLLAQQIVVLTGTTLVEIDPAHRSLYQANVNRLITQLKALDQQLKTQLAPVKSVPYIVFHAAYHYFERAYGLNAVGSITIDPGRQPGAKRIAAIHAKIKRLHARCVFSEPQFESRLVTTVTEGTAAGKGVLDPLGADIPTGPKAYFRLMTQLGNNLYAGLK